MSEIRDEAPDGTRDLYARALKQFGEKVHAVGEDQWANTTPCSEWDVRALVNHLVNENKWTPPLLAGSRIEDVGDRFDGDLLGADPHAAWEESAAEAKGAVTEEAALKTVHLSFGEAPGREYVMQLFADHLIHAWDLARAVHGDERLDPELVQACAEWFRWPRRSPFRPLPRRPRRTAIRSASRTRCRAMAGARKWSAP